MKAVLLMEMPKNCYECKTVITTGKNAAFCPEDYFCFWHGDKDSVKDCDSKRADFCPLRPTPSERKVPDEGTEPYVRGIAQGFNLCLRAIEGSGENA